MCTGNQSDDKEAAPGGCGESVRSSNLHRILRGERQCDLPVQAPQDILSCLAMSRARCDRRAKSLATSMGDEMFHRYQR
jgi:hypothetical protein